MPIDLACTGCRRRLSVRDEFAGRQVRCPGCGAMVLAATGPAPAPGPVLPGYAGPFFAPPEAPPPDVPGRASIAVLLSPSAFFAGQGARSTVGQAARVGLPFLLLGAFATAVQLHLVSRWLGPSARQTLRDAGLGEELQEALLGRASSFRMVLENQLLFDALGLLLFPLFLHLGAMIVGATGFRRTCSIYYYSLCARLLDLLPGGPVVSMIYVLILNYFGMRNVHRLSEGRSLLAVLVALLSSAMAMLILFGCFALLHGIELPTPR